MEEKLPPNKIPPEKIPHRLRAADTDRERVASAIQAAGGEGRLTLDEVEQRLTAVYAARFTDELGELTADLPRRTDRPSPRDALRHPAVRIHLAVVVGIILLMTVRWAVAGPGLFWPAFPALWLLVSVLAHVRMRGWAARRGPAVPY